MNIVWVQLSQLTGKGLTYYEIVKLLFLMGVSVISLVLPLTILLSSIMTFGGLGERYELVAMKAAGIPLYRVMRPLFFIVILLSLLLFWFANNIIPDTQRKAKNMLNNIVLAKPVLSFTPGQFIQQVPGYSLKFDKISGENGEKVEGVFIHKNTAFDNNQAIVAKKGKFSPAENRRYLKFTLFDGYVYEDNASRRRLNDRYKQPNQSIKFDTFVMHLDISELIDKALEKENITDDYRFNTYGELNKSILDAKKENTEKFGVVKDELVMQTNSYVGYIDNVKKKKTPQHKLILDSLKKDKQPEVLYAAYNKIDNLKNTVNIHEDEIRSSIKYHNKVIMYQQRIITHPITCIIFFLIGASLGSIVRKGGFGMPAIIAIVIYIIFYILNISIENLSWKGKVDPYLAAWLPNIILFPFGIWLTSKALTDSQLFDPERYNKLLKPITKFFKKEKEHQRYQ